MATVLAIIWVIIFISLILLAVCLGCADAINVSSSKENKSIYSEPEDFE